MKKVITRAASVAAFLAIFSVTSCLAGHVKAQQEKARLVDFIEYCQKNEGLQHADTTVNYRAAKMHDLKSVANFFLGQRCFDDVTSYDEIEDVCRILRRDNNE